MRDLRSNIRNYTEPIEIVTLKKVFVDGEATTVVDGDNRLVYGNVMLDKDRTANGTNGASTIDNSVVIEMLNPRFELIPELNTLIIREQQYLINRINGFNLNAETIIVYATIKNG